MVRLDDRSGGGMLLNGLVVHREAAVRSQLDRSCCSSGDRYRISGTEEHINLARFREQRRAVTLKQLCLSPGKRKSRHNKRQK